MPQSDGNVFLVVEPDPTVARDVEEDVQGFDPDAVVWLAVSAAEAKAMLSGLEKLTAAFLHLPAAELRRAEIPEGVEAIGGRVVVLDVRPSDPWEEERRDWLYTGWPFGAGAVARMLERIGAPPG